MQAIITVGLGFGDEGKGATVDFLTRALGADLVVRYCGGAQAGHNVQLPDGRRHTFSQFGAGTFAGAKTYLGPRMIICPSTMVPEADHLRELGVDDPWSMIAAHSSCLVSTSYHAWMNRLRECARGDARHGSCGLGIGESRHYWLRYGQDAIIAKDLDQSSHLVDKLTLLRDRFLLEMQEFDLLDASWAERLHGWSPREEADLLRRAGDGLSLADRMPSCDSVVFEGAQGVLLDEWKGFHPHTTWSTVTADHAIEMLADFPKAQVTILGLTRAYATRHGAGPFPSFCEVMTDEMRDRGNPHNDWQGSIQFGPLDLMLLEYAARVCEVDGLFVSGVDELPDQPRVVTGYRNWTRLPAPGNLQAQQQLTDRLKSVTPIEETVTQDRLLAMLSDIAPLVGTAHGPTHQDRKFHAEGVVTCGLQRDGMAGALSL